MPKVRQNSKSMSLHQMYVFRTLSEDILPTLFTSLHTAYNKQDNVMKYILTHIP